MKIEWNGLETILDPKKNILSISQKKRLNMARLLLRQPKILFIND